MIFFFMTYPSATFVIRSWCCTRGLYFAVRMASDSLERVDSRFFRSSKGSGFPGDFHWNTTWSTERRSVVSSNTRIGMRLRHFRLHSRDALLFSAMRLIGILFCPDISGWNFRGEKMRWKKTPICYKRHCKNCILKEQINLYVGNFTTIFFRFFFKIFFNWLNLLYSYEVGEGFNKYSVKGPKDICPAFSFQRVRLKNIQWIFNINRNNYLRWNI